MLRTKPLLSILILIIVVILLFFILTNNRKKDDSIGWLEEKNSIVVNLEKNLNLSKKNINEREEFLNKDELELLLNYYNEIKRGVDSLKEKLYEKQEFKLLSNELLNEIVNLQTKIIGDLEIEFLPKEGIEAQELIVKDKYGFVKYQLSFNELKEWMKLNWDIFSETPEIGGREVEVNNFNFFDRHGSVSPNNEKLIFSVHDYAVATSKTFILVLDLKNEDLFMLDEAIRGSIEGFSWSDDSIFVAFSLGTARAVGDFLSVINTDELNKKFILSELDILEIIDPQKEYVEVGQFMPYFRDLNWRAYNSLEFKTDDLLHDTINWLVNSDGSGLEILD